MTLRVCAGLAVCACLVAGGAASAQQVPVEIRSVTQAKPSGPESPMPESNPVRIDVTLSRTKGTAKISSLPYSINATGGSRASLRVGSKVPVANAVAGGGPGTPITSYTYQNVGTNIDCELSTIAPGLYRLNLTLDDSSIGTGDDKAIVSPVIRSYTITTTLVLRDGQVSTFNVATDKVSGETIQGQVTVTGIK